MIFTFVVVSPNNPEPEIFTLNWQASMTLQGAMEMAANQEPFGFALQYNGPTMPGYNVIMVNGLWANETGLPQPNNWYIQLNGQPFAAGIETYTMEDKDVVVFTYGTAPATPPTATKSTKAAAKA